MILSEARTTLTDSVLHIGATVIGDDKKDRAIRESFHEFVSKTNCLQATTAVSLAAATATVNIAGTITGFIPDYWVRGFIGYSEVALTTWDDVASLLGVAVPRRGRPVRIAIKTPTVAAVWPVPDAAYSLDVTYTQPFPTITPGGSGSTDLLVPDEWAGRILHTGTKWYLLNGAPGHPDAVAAEKAWMALLEEARLHFAEPQPGVADRQTQPHPAKPN